MPKSKRSRRDDDEDSLVDSEEEDIIESNSKHKAKKPKPSKPSSSATPGNDEYWELSSSAKNHRRANISVFKNTVLVNIREYYENSEGELLPGKKGISLSIDQYNHLLRAIPHINAKLREMDKEVDEPEILAEHSKDKDDARSASKIRFKPDRSNIEATSDEDED